MLSIELAQILDLKQAPYLKIINSLWLYIQLNRLQDSDKKNLIICNKELKSIFGAERVEFCHLNKLLTYHLTPPPPVKITLKVTKGKQFDHIEDFIVNVPTHTRPKLRKYIVEHQIEHFEDAPSACLNKMKQEEAKINEQIKILIERMHRSAEKANFYSEYAINAKSKIDQTLIHQKDLLKILASN